MISLVIPVYNEKASLEELLRRVVAVDMPKELIVVDDCSTDGCREILSRLAERGLDGLTGAHPVNANRLEVLFQETNQGKGAALRRGFGAATGDVVVVQDADLEYDPREIPRLVGPILDGHADVVYGSRFMGGKPHRILFFWHTIGNRLLTFLSNMFTNLNLTDMETCYKLFRTEIIQSMTLQEKRFGFEPEVTARIARVPKVRVYEVGISYYGRTYAEGKHIGWKDGVRAIYCILKYNLLLRD